MRQGAESALICMTFFKEIANLIVHYHGDFRYYNYIKEKIALIHDIFDFVKYPKNYYTPKNPLEAKKIDPV